MTTTEVQEAVAQILADRCSFDVVRSAAGTWAPDLWDVLAQYGLTTVGIDEECGGSGGTALEAAAVVRVAARFAAPIPIAESTIVTRRVSRATGMKIVGPVAICLIPRARQRDEDVAVRVSWAPMAKSIVVVAEGTAAAPDRMAVVRPSSIGIDDGVDVARQPWAVVNLLSGIDYVEAPGLFQVTRLAGAVARAVQIAGACERVLDMTTEYAKVRNQFGRPISQYQAIQHYLATMTAETLAAQAAALSAVGDLDGNLLTSAAAAKIRCGQAATTVARLAHQIHGAIGFTKEHPLSLMTTRLWAWREQFGSETYWRRELGAAVVNAGPAALWPRITTPAAAE